MADVRPFEVLFLTNFSNSCFRTVPSLARLADEVDLRLTMLHASGDERPGPRLEAELRSFFPEADHYAHCRRVVTAGDPFDAVRRICADTAIDLIVAPAGDPLGLPRIGHSSLRSRLVSDVGIPMWTVGQGAHARRYGAHTRRVACCVDLDGSGRAHLRMACEYAQSMGATLHLVHMLPEVNESSLLMLAYADPFDREHAADAVRREVASASLVPEVHVTDRGRLAETLRQIDADVVFLDGEAWTTRRWLRRRVDPVLDSLPCPVVAINARRTDVEWHVPKNPARQKPARTFEPATAAALAGDAQEPFDAFAMAAAQPAARATRQAAPGQN